MLNCPSLCTKCRFPNWPWGKNMEELQTIWGCSTPSILAAAVKQHYIPPNAEACLLVWKCAKVLRIICRLFADVPHLFMIMVWTQAGCFSVCLWWWCTSDAQKKANFKIWTCSKMFLVRRIFRTTTDCLQTLADWKFVHCATTAQENLPSSR